MTCDSFHDAFKKFGKIFSQNAAEKMVMKSDRNPNPNKKSPSKTTWDFLLLDFFLRISRHKKKKQGIGVNKKKYGSVKVTEITEESPQLKHPWKLRNGDPQWWALEMVDSFEKMWPFLVSTLPKTKSYFCSPLRRKSLPIHPKNGSRSKVSQQRPSGAFDVSFTEWKPQKMERESSYTRPRNKPTKKIPQLPPSPRKKGRQLQAFKGEEKKSERKTNPVVWWKNPLEPLGE